MGPGRVSKGLNWVQPFATLSRTPVEGRDSALKSLSRPSLFLEGMMQIDRTVNNHSNERGRYSWIYGSGRHHADDTHRIAL